MLHTKSQGHRPYGSGEEDFHIWAWRPSWSCDHDHSNKLLFPRPKDLSLIGKVVSEEMVRMLTDGRVTVGRRSDWYTISSFMSLRLR